jgi:hypothetical protein
VFRFWRVFRNLLRFDDLKRIFFSVGILFLELFLFQKFVSLFNILPHIKGRKELESNRKAKAMGGFFWISWADKSDPNMWSVSRLSKIEEWLLEILIHVFDISEGPVDKVISGPAMNSKLVMDFTVQFFTFSAKV